MTHPDNVLERVLAERAEQAPSGVEVTHRVLAAAPIRTRRRRWGAAGLTAVAVAGVVIAAVLLAPEPEAPSDAPVATQPSRSLRYPDGSKLIVYRGIQVTVPAYWSPFLGGQICTGVDQTVLLQVPGTPMQPVQQGVCAVLGGNSWVELRTIQSRWVIAGTGRAADVGGERAFLGIHKGNACFDTLGVAARCAGNPALKDDFLGRLAVPGRDTAIWVHSPDRDLIRRILDSVRVVDRSTVRVPDLIGLTKKAALRRLTILGLLPELVGDDAGGIVTGQTPAAGEPAPADAQVRVEIGRPTRPAG